MKTHTTAMDDSLFFSSSFQKMRFSTEKKKEKDDDEYTFSAYTHTSPCHGRNDCITTKTSQNIQLLIQWISRSYQHPNPELNEIVLLLFLWKKKKPKWWTHQTPDKGECDVVFLYNEKFNVNVLGLRGSDVDGIKNCCWWKLETFWIEIFKWISRFDGGKKRKKKTEKKRQMKGLSLDIPAFLHGHSSSTTWDEWIEHTIPCTSCVVLV